MPRRTYTTITDRPHAPFDDTCRARGTAGGACVGAEGGFSLVEILAVVVVLAIVLAFGAPLLLGAMQRGQDPVIAASARQLWSGIEQYRLDHDDRLPSPDLLTQRRFVSASKASYVPRWPEGRDGAPLSVAGDAAATPPMQRTAQAPHVRYHVDPDGASGWLAGYDASGKATFVRHVQWQTAADRSSESEPRG